MKITAFVPADWRRLLVLAGVLAVVPLLFENDYYLLIFNVLALNALVVLGLNVLIGCAGQVSFGHAAFYGMGAYFSAVATVTWGWPLGLALVFALLGASVVGWLLALPTLRLEGHYLVMATLGFNIIFSILVNQWEDVTGGPPGFYGIPRLSLGSWKINTDREFYYFIWVVFLVLFGLTLNLKDSRVGRALHAIHERDMTSRVLGVPVHRYKVATFVLSAAFAALAGFCYAHYVTFISPHTFDIFYSVQVVTMVAVGGMGSLWGGLAGTALLTFLPEALHGAADYHIIIYGLILVVVLMYCPQGLLPALAGLPPWRWARGRFAARDAVKAPPPAKSGLFAEEADGGAEGRPGSLETLLESRGQPGEPVLSLEHVSLSFGGVQALQSVGMECSRGVITALIGPNGAGKTTLLNVISGLLKPQEGTLRFGDVRLETLSPDRIAAKGVGRTFQAVQIFQGFTTLENVMLGLHTRSRAGFLAGFLHAPAERREEAASRRHSLEFLEAFGLAGKADLPAGELSLYEQKMVELIRALALEPSLLLLDEPAGGLNPRESEALMGHLRRLRELGLAIVLVEHDMNVVMRLADRVVVLRNGCKIADGPPREVQRDPTVISAYLGTGGL